MKERIRHKAKLFDDKGNASALCFKIPHAINMKTQSWVIKNEFVTCLKCLKIITEDTNEN